MEFRSGNEAKETGNRNEETKIESERSYFGEPDEPDYKNVHGQIKAGSRATKPGDVRNGDLVSLLLAATPPYLYNVPLVPQTFFFSEMLKSFVQAKVERQNLKAQQSHARRQRKRTWREMTPPRTYDARDKPLELTTAKQLDEKQKPGDEKPQSKKYQSSDATEKKFHNSKLSNSSFTVEKLANSSISGCGEGKIGGGHATAGDLIPQTPPPWYPLLYPPHPPYGIDPLHFFIDLRVSAQVGEGKSAGGLLTGYPTAPVERERRKKTSRDEKWGANATDDSGDESKCQDLRTSASASSESFPVETDIGGDVAAAAAAAAALQTVSVD